MMFFLHRSLRFLCGFLPVLPMVAVYYFVEGKAAGRHATKKAPLHLAGALLFCLYIFSVFFVTDIPDMLHFRLEPSVNLVPFNDIFTNTMQYFLNILLFVPLGFLLPALWTKFESKRRTFLCGALLSLFIELIQLFNYRATDIDDLLMNTAGGVAGYFLFRLIRAAFPRISVFSLDDSRRLRGEPYIYALLVWLSVFFIQPVLSGWLLGLVFQGRVIIG